MAMSARGGFVSNDQVEAILARLPVKSLMRFKSVSKQWILLISDPYFIKKHKAFNDSAMNGEINLFVCGTGVESPCSIRIEGNFDSKEEGILRAVPPTVFPVLPEDRIRIGAAHCNGLLCLLTEVGTVVVWNPSTRESKRFDAPPTLNSETCIGLGLGYVSKNDEYMVVVVGCYHNSSNNVQLLHVLSLKTGLWKAVANNEPDLMWAPRPNQVAIALNGFLYWVTVKGSVICFDLERDAMKFEFIDNIGGRGRGVLGILGESLCLAAIGRSGLTDIWVKKEECWSILKRIPFLRNEFEGSPTEMICLIGTNKMLLREPLVLYMVLYNLEDLSADKIVLNQSPVFNYRPWWTITQYEVSLVRLNQV